MKLEHIIGRDGLHRLRLTAANGEIIDNSHEGFSSEAEALANLVRKLRAYRELGFLQATVLETHIDVYQEAYSAPTVDEREPNVACVPYLERVPQDPLEPQTQTPDPRPRRTEP